MIEAAVLDAFTAMTLARHRNVSSAELAQYLARNPEQVVASLERLQERGVVVARARGAGVEPLWDVTERSASSSTARVATSVLLVLREQPSCTRSRIGEILGEPEERVDAALHALQRDRLAVPVISERNPAAVPAKLLWLVAEPSLLPFQGAPNRTYATTPRSRIFAQPPARPDRALD